MSFSERTVQGFALAAAIADDRGAALAEPGIAPPAARALLTIPRRLASLSSAARRREIERITAALRPALPSHPCLPPRALALIAPLAPKPDGRRWLESAPPPRPDYRPEPGLREIVRRVAMGELRNRKTGT
jgi:hypothetical protein